ncbi:unnamed protein product [Phytomonas sp. Hart1]|nr:unnamed protein product [Phytomonas sp. Hart1]|eukprot:CCW66376.1 unnamed protein product [Phytomonas sp. isolate Hart1]
MPVIEVFVIKALDIRGVTLQKAFKVYLRLQQQCVCSEKTTESGGEIYFREKFRLNYDPNHYTRENRLFVELWKESFLSNLCVCVAWVQLDTQNFVRGEPTTLSLRGRFEDSQATFIVSIVPIDFGSVSQLPSQDEQPVLGIPIYINNSPTVNCSFDNLPAVPPQYSPADPSP